MTEETMIRSRIPVWARMAVLLLFAPLVALIPIIMLDPSVPSTSRLLGPLLVLSASCLLVGLAFRASAYVAVSEESVRMGFAPLWSTRVRLDDVADVSVREVDPYRDYHGWGIKGSASSRAGRLYSTGGGFATVIRTKASRRYLVAFRDERLAVLAAERLSVARKTGDREDVSMRE
jgi:hypothetical protein